MKPLNLIVRLEAARKAAETGEADLRIVACPECDGAGVIEYGDHEHGGTARCRICGGSGREEITVEPITLDDLPEGDILSSADLWMANRLEQLAEEWMVTAKDANTDEARGVCVAEAMAYRRVASGIRGGLQRQADRDAREAEDMGTSW